MKITAVIGTVREQSLGDQIGKWIESQAESITSALHGVELNVVYLRDFQLPMFDAAGSPMAMNKTYPNPEQQNWSDAIDQADGYLFVSPEYNHSVPGAFKNAVDSLGSEWLGKTVAFVGYGGVGGVRAIEHWRAVLATFQMRTLRPEVNIFTFGPASSLNDDGAFVPSDYLNQRLAEVIRAIAEA